MARHIDFDVRPFRSSDADSVNRIALAAFTEFRDAYQDWDSLSVRLERTADMAAEGELIVATVGHPGSDEDPNACRGSGCRVSSLRGTDALQTGDVQARMAGGFVCWSWNRPSGAVALAGL